MVKVVQRGAVRIYVYQESGHRHHLPHCHVYWPGGACVIALGDVRVLVGGEPPEDAWRLVRDNIDDLRAAWERLHPRGLR